MKRFMYILAVVLLVSSLFACATKTPLPDTSVSLTKLDFQGFSNLQGTIFDRDMALLSKMALPSLILSN